MIFKPTIIFLMGPTASGKTELSVQLVQALPCDIISVDSAMVYRGMDIGTAKPTVDLLKVAPHRLINICDPEQSYSAAQFRQDALKEINASIAQGRIPLLTGGTMLYFRALQYGLSPLPSADALIRQRLAEEANVYGLNALHERLQKVDPEAAKRIHVNDPQRLQRALEVYELTGEPMTSFFNKMDNVFPYNVLALGIAPQDRSVLHDRIEKRFDNMLRQGFVEEVSLLFNRGDLGVDLPSMRAVGYRQIWEYLSGTIGYDEMRERGIIATRQLAKRQMTWLRTYESLQMFEAFDDKLFKKVLDHLLQLI